MTRRMTWAALVALVAASVALSHAQSASRPQFRSGVEYVEVDVRVVDANGRPVGNLTQSDFAVVEDGVPQTVRTFTAVDLPLPTGKPQPISATGVKPDVSSNVLTSMRGRSYLIVLDTPFIGSRRTVPVRKFLRDFIERSIGPNDLVGITTTG